MDVHPREAVDCVMNVFITDKKEAGQIRMNVDATPINKGIKMTNTMCRLQQKSDMHWMEQRCFQSLIWVMDIISFFCILTQPEELSSKLMRDSTA